MSPPVIVYSGKIKTFLCLSIVLLVSYFTYLKGYEQPNNFFWDENYHITSAQKYLHGVFFMELHPPLGKLLLALGEKIIDANPADDQFIDTNYGQSSGLPKNFSFAGYRLFPALLAWLSAGLIFSIFLLITENRLLSLFLSAWYVFDNAMIVHSRGAMLEGIQIFFFLSLILIFLLLLAWKEESKKFTIGSLLFGLVFGCLLAIKINSLIAILLVPALLIGLRFKLPRVLSFLISFVIGTCLTFFSCWYLHFAIGKEVRPKLDNKGYFQASSEYQEILRQGKSSDLSSFPTMLRDTFYHFIEYNIGVPQLNLCKPGENGSPAFLWPLGGRSINYRWEKSGHDKYRYLYLQSNPFGWFTTFGAVLLGAGLLICPLLLPTSARLKKPLLLATFLAMYFGYMLVVVRVTRVLYLYHYFIPLVLGFCILALVALEVSKIGSWELTPVKKNSLFGVLGLGVLGSFLWYSPLTYYQPITVADIGEKAVLGLWDLRCPDCERTNGFAFSQKKPHKRRQSVRLRLDSLEAYDVFQQWGKARVDQTVTGYPLVVAGKQYQSGFGVHAYSSMKFRLKKRFRRFYALVGLPDHLKERGGTSTFEIKGDGKRLWTSPVLHSGEPAKEVSVSVEGVDELELIVSDAKDGITHDHGLWLEPRLAE